jgi:DNA primase
MAVDFKELRDKLSIESVAAWLGLELKRSGEQLRGQCPCGKSGDRAFTVTPSKGLYRCFEKGCPHWGDGISLTALARNTTQKDAAAELQRHFIGQTPSQTPQNGTGAKDLASVASYLIYDHESVQALGIDAQTAKYFTAGYKPKGMFSGRIAIAIHDQAGTLIGYMGHAAKKGQEPIIAFPKDVEPDSFIFNAHRIEGDDLMLTDCPIKVMAAHQHGIQAVALLTTTACSLRLLADFLEAKKVTSADWM